MDHRRSLIYIAGPISSNPDGYRAAFAAAEAALRADGYDTINPAENPPHPSWEAYMRCSIAQLITADGIALLPGWEASRGAMLESHIAHALGFEVIVLKPPTPSLIAEAAQEERE